MDLVQLKSFRTVARALNFTKAAEELGITQPAVSHQIKSLEEELGEDLFIRAGNKISLSQEGKVVLAYAEKMAGQIELMRREIENPDQKHEGTVRLVAITRALGNPFPELRQAWIEKDTGIDLTFTAAMDSESIIDHVRNGEADIGFSTLTEEFLGLLSIPYGQFEMIVTAGKSEKLVGKKGVALEELRDKEWILFEKGSWVRRETDKIFERHSFEPERIYETNDGLVIKTLVAEGNGISLLPEWGIHIELESGDLFKIGVKDVNTMIPIRLILRESGRLNAVNVFANFLLEMPLTGIKLNNKTGSK